MKEAGAAEAGGFGGVGAWERLMPPIATHPAMTTRGAARRNDCSHERSRVFGKLPLRVRTRRAVRRAGPNALPVSEWYAQSRRGSSGRSIDLPSPRAYHGANRSIPCKDARPSGADP